MFGIRLFAIEDKLTVFHKQKPPPSRGLHRIPVIRLLLYRKVKHTNPDGKTVSVLVSRRGATIGEGVRLGHGVVVKAYAWVDDHTWIGDEVLVGKRARIGTRATIRNLTTVGRKAKIGTRVNIGHMVKVGDRVNIGPDAWIGTDSILGKRAKVLATVRMPVRTHAEARTTTRDNLPKAGLTVQHAKKHRRWQSASEAQPATKS